MKSSNRILVLGTTLTCLTLTPSAIQASQPVITAAQELTAIQNLKPVYAYGSSDQFSITSLYDAFSDMDTMTMGTAASSTPSYWSLSSNTLNCLATQSATWVTFGVGSLASSWAATTSISIPETVNNGATVGSPARVITLYLKATGTPAALTQAQVQSALQSSTVTAIPAGATNAAAVTLIGATKLNVSGTSNWDVMAYVSTGTALTLDPLSATCTWNGLTSGNATLAFNTALPAANVLGINPTSGIPTSFSLPFVLQGRTLTMSINPSVLSKTTGIIPAICSSLTAGLGGGTIHRINVANQSFMDDIPTALASYRNKLTATPGSNSCQAISNTNMKALVTKAGFVVGSFTTTVDTNKWGLVYYGPASLTSVSWGINPTNSTNLQLTGTIGGAAKTFTFNLAGLQTINSSTNTVLQATSTDGEAVFMKAFDATGCDVSADTSVPSAYLPSLLTMEMLQIMSGVATVSSLTEAGFIAGS